MRPGVWSDVGFLGPHERLEEVLSADAQKLVELGVTAPQLGDPLALLLEAPGLADSFFDDIAPDEVKEYRTARRRELERSLGPPISTTSGARVGDRFEVECVAISFGIQECPWSRSRGSGICGSGSFDWRIRNLVNGCELCGPELIAHLIGAHGFFEGRESPYRVEPGALAQLLQLGDVPRA